MNPIFRISRRRRLAAYKRAGELLATRDESYMCLALRGALWLEKLEALEAFRFADAVWCDLYEEGGAVGNRLRLEREHAAHCRRGMARFGQSEK